MLSRRAGLSAIAGLSCFYQQPEACHLTDRVRINAAIDRLLVCTTVVADYITTSPVMSLFLS